MCVRGGAVPGGGELVVDGEDPPHGEVLLPRGRVADIDDNGIDVDEWGGMADPTPPDGGGGMVDPTRPPCVMVVVISPVGAIVVVVLILPVGSILILLLLLLLISSVGILIIAVAPTVGTTVPC